MVAHAGCRVCQNGARGWQNGRRRDPDAPREFRWPGKGGRWPWAMIYSQWPPQKMQLRAHGMLMAHVRDLGFSRLSSNILAPTCMDTIRVTYTASTHTNTVHTIHHGTVVRTLTILEGTGQLELTYMHMGQ